MFVNVYLQRVETCPVRVALPAARLLLAELLSKIFFVTLN